jgi:hypothetical protein
LIGLRIGMPEQEEAAKTTNWIRVEPGDVIFIEKFIKLAERLHPRVSSARSVPTYARAAFKANGPPPQEQEALDALGGLRTDFAPTRDVAKSRTSAQSIGTRILEAMPIFHVSEKNPAHLQIELIRFAISSEFVLPGLLHAQQCPGPHDAC